MKLTYLDMNLLDMVKCLEIQQLQALKHFDTNGMAQLILK